MLLNYYYKNINCLQTNEYGESVIVPSEDYLKVKKELYDLLIKEHDFLLKYEEKLTKKYK